ncbi:MAG TPA: hypothetical protein VM261_12080 [Kofleriaceae bacterium]|nr:hypothetical protein [Kofleriaceae bacterium]
MGDLRCIAALAFAALAFAACGDDELRPLDVDASLDAPLPDAVPDAAADAASGAPMLTLDEATYTIGPDPVLVSGDTDTALMTLRNDGAGAANDLAFTVTPANGEMSVLSNCGTSLAPGAACTVSAQLNPSSAGMKMFTVSVASAEGPGDSAMVSGVGGSRVRITVNNIAVGAATIDGHVTSAPAGIDCGTGMTMCEFVFTAPGPVVLTGTDDGAGTLVDWNLSGCPVTDPCVLDLTRNYTATVAFNAPASVASTSATGTSDEANGVALDAASSIVIAGRSGTSALLARFDRTGAFVAGATFGPATRRSLDVSIATDGIVAAAGEQNSDATLSLSPADLLTEPARQVITGAGADRSNGICHDDVNNIYMVGDHGDRMSWGRWPTGMTTPAYLFDTTTPQGVALGATWDQNVLWIAGALANQTGWLGKVDAATGTLTTPTTVTGMMLASSVAAYGTAAGGDLVVAGWTTGNLVVRRYTPALVEVWTRTYASAADIHPDVAIEAETGAIYIAYDTSTGCTLRKIKGDGSPVWTRNALGTHCEDVAVNVEGAVVAGWTQVGGDRKYFAKKFFH